MNNDEDANPLLLHALTDLQNYYVKRLPRPSYAVAPTQLSIYGGDWEGPNGPYTLSAFGTGRYKPLPSGGGGGSSTSTVKETTKESSVVQIVDPGAKVPEKKMETSFTHGGKPWQISPQDIIHGPPPPPPTGLPAQDLSFEDLGSPIEDFSISTPVTRPSPSKKVVKSLKKNALAARRTFVDTPPGTEFHDQRVRNMKAFEAAKYAYGLATNPNLTRRRSSLRSNRVTPYSTPYRSPKRKEYLSYSPGVEDVLFG